MNKGSTQAKRTRSMMAALTVAALAGGAACNAISGAGRSISTVSPDAR